jgi:hypothetical protein
MLQSKILGVKKELILGLSQIAFIIAIATIVPLFHQQLITGPIINAMLFIAVVVLGAEKAVLTGLIPSLIALSIGLLPAVLLPMIPFIMVGNTVLILVFDFFRKKNYWLGAVLASFFKFLFLFSTSSVVINLLLQKEVAKNVALMMSWPQLFTALAGSLIAYLFLKTVKKINYGK